MKAHLAPKIAQAGMPGFLLWARRDNPALYRAMVQQLPEVAEFDIALRDGGMAGFSLSGAFSKVTNAAKKIGSFVANNALPLAAAAVPVIVAKKQADIAKAQVRLAEAQLAPMQTAVDPSGVAIPVQPTAGGGWQAVPVQGGMIASSVSVGSTGAINWKLWAGVGAAALVGLVLIARR